MLRLSASPLHLPALDISLGVVRWGFAGLAALATLATLALLLATIHSSRRGERRPGTTVGGEPVAADRTRGPRSRSSATPWRRRTIPARWCP